MSRRDRLRLFAPSRRARRSRSLERRESREPASSTTAPVSGAGACARAVALRVIRRIARARTVRTRGRSSAMLAMDSASASRRRLTTARNALGRKRRRAEGSSAAFCRRRKSTAEPLGRFPGSEGANRRLADSRAASPSPAVRPSGYSKRRAFTHSGGTAPDLHRTSPLCPRGHPRQAGMLTQHGDWRRKVIVDSHSSCPEAMTLEDLARRAMEGDRKLKTWVYRIAVNYILDVKKSPVERMHLTFEGFAEDLTHRLSSDGPGRRRTITAHGGGQDRMHARDAPVPGQQHRLGKRTGRDSRPTGT